MGAADRRNAILKKLEDTTAPLPAARLGEDLGVPCCAPRATRSTPPTAGTFWRAPRRGPGAR